MSTNETPAQPEASASELDSSRTARQIYALGDVEKDIARLLQLASSSISLLTLPQTDGETDNLPQGEERSEQFVLEVSEYFERLDNIQFAIRSSLAHIRQSRIPPTSIDAPSQGFRPRAPGVGLPPLNRQDPLAEQPKIRGLQEERTDRDAWQGMLDALTRMRDLRAREREDMKDEQGDVTMS